MAVGTLAHQAKLDQGQHTTEHESQSRHQASHLSPAAASSCGSTQCSSSHSRKKGNAAGKTPDNTLQFGASTLQNIELEILKRHFGDRERRQELGSLVNVHSAVLSRGHSSPYMGLPMSDGGDLTSGVSADVNQSRGGRNIDIPPPVPQFSPHGQIKARSDMGMKDHRDSSSLQLVRESSKLYAQPSSAAARPTKLSTSTPASSSSYFLDTWRAPSNSPKVSALKNWLFGGGKKTAAGSRRVAGASAPCVQRANTQPRAAAGAKAAAGGARAATAAKATPHGRKGHKGTSSSSKSSTRTSKGSVPLTKKDLSRSTTTSVKTFIAACRQKMTRMEEQIATLKQRVRSLSQREKQLRTENARLITENAMLRSRLKDLSEVGIGGIASAFQFHHHHHQSTSSSFSTSSDAHTPRACRTHASNDGYRGRFGSAAVTGSSPSLAASANRSSPPQPPNDSFFRGSNSMDDTVLVAARRVHSAEAEVVVDADAELARCSSAPPCASAPPYQASPYQEAMKFSSAAPGVADMSAALRRSLSDMSAAQDSSKNKLAAPVPSRWSFAPHKSSRKSPHRPTSPAEAAIHRDTPKRVRFEHPAVFSLDAPSPRASAIVGIRSASPSLMPSKIELPTRRKAKSSSSLLPPKAAHHRTRSRSLPENIVTTPKRFASKSGRPVALINVSPYMQPSQFVPSLDTPKDGFKTFGRIRRAYS